MQDKKTGEYLSYYEITKLKNFQKLLLEAMTSHTCLVCGGLEEGRGLTGAGTCLECGAGNTQDKKDSKAHKKVLRMYEIDQIIRVRERTKEEQNLYDKE